MGQRGSVAVAVPVEGAVNRREVLGSRGVVEVLQQDPQPASDPLVAGLLAASGASSLPVVDASRRYFGVLNAHEIVDAVAAGSGVAEAISDGTALITAPSGVRASAASAGSSPPS